MGRDGTVGVGVIGRGFGQNVVAPVFAETDRCTLVDVISPRDADAVRALSEHPDVDVVAVHAPPFMHLQCVSAALDAGKAVLCDKPFGTSTADAEAMEAAARDADAVALLNFEFRHHPGRIALRALIQDGAIGTVEHVQWTVFGAGFRVPLRPYGWLFDRERGGGWIGAWGSHVIDFLRWTFGDITDASARLRTDISERPDADGTLHPCTAEDGFTALLTTGTDVSVTIDTTFAAVKNSPPRVVILGSDGTLESIADGKITLRNDEGTQDVFTFDAPREDPHLVPMRAWAQVVRDSVRDGAVHDGVPTFADGVECARVMDALRGVSA
ncbi:MAG TPA: Gfo/Idh/MocA family oxidoreductase [Acidimicrobiia bacterium]